MKKPYWMLELERQARLNPRPSDIIDKLEAEDGFVELTLSDGSMVVGKPDFIDWDGEDGLDKKIRFVPINRPFHRGIYYRAEDIISYIPIDVSTEDPVPIRVYGFVDGVPVEIHTDTKKIYKYPSKNSG